MVIPFAAGGPQDTIGRVVALRMGEVLGQTVVVENIGGAGGKSTSYQGGRAQVMTESLHGTPRKDSGRGDGQQGLPSANGIGKVAAS